MCTVTFFPQGNTKYILTSNRDVAPGRHSDLLAVREIAGEKVLFPQDPLAGGTWIAVRPDGAMVCLLNGGFVKHKSLPPYRKSRGLVVLDSFEWDSFEAFAKSYEFEGIEPFTLIGVRPAEGFFEFRWTGSVKFLRKLSGESPVIFSSSTLFGRKVRKMRQKWFDDWLVKMGDMPTADAILRFHKEGGEPDPVNGFVMNRRNVVCTTSVTQVVFDGVTARIRHEDLISGKSVMQEV